MKLIGNIGKYLRVKNSITDPIALRAGAGKAYSSVAADPKGKHP